MEGVAWPSTDSRLAFSLGVAEALSGYMAIPPVGRSGVAARVEKFLSECLRICCKGLGPIGAAMEEEGEGVTSESTCPPLGRRTAGTGGRGAATAWPTSAALCPEKDSLPTGHTREPLGSSEICLAGDGVEEEEEDEGRSTMMLTWLREQCAQTR
eukprot:scaffold5939_cov165-Ochromonas_danica.AAC.8